MTRRTNVDLRTGHERLDADVDMEPALHALQHTAGQNQTFCLRLFEIVPDAEARGLLVREQDVAFRLPRNGRS